MTHKPELQSGDALADAKVHLPLGEQLVERDCERMHDIEWTIERYLLEDPTLNVADFEQRMLEDTDLAQRVAASVSHLQLVTEATRRCEVQLPVRPTGAASASVHHRAWFAPVLASAACGLLALGVTLVPGTQQQSPSTTAKAEPVLFDMAEKWLAYESDQSVERLLSTESLEVEMVTETVLPEDASQSDWVVEAVRQFYLENADEVSG